MSLLRFLALLAVGTILSWAAWVLTLMMLDPYSSGFIALALFYSSLFLAVVGTLTIIGFFIRYWLEKEKIPFQQIRTSLRQATLVSATLIMSLALQAKRLLNPWTVIVLLLLLLVTEVFFLAGSSRRERRPAT